LCNRLLGRPYIVPLHSLHRRCLHLLVNFCLPQLPKKSHLLLPAVAGPNAGLLARLGVVVGYADLPPGRRERPTWRSLYPRRHAVRPPFRRGKLTLLARRPPTVLAGGSCSDAKRHRSPAVCGQPQASGAQFRQTACRSARLRGAPHRCAHSAGTRRRARGAAATIRPASSAWPRAAPPPRALSPRPRCCLR
jgi:hypothetical protein